MTKNRSVPEDQPKSSLTWFDLAGAVVAGYGQHGWWKCMGCGGFAGYESSPSASAAMPWCRTGKHFDEEGKELIPLSGYSLTYEPVPEEFRLG